MNTAAPMLRWCVAALAGAMLCAGPVRAADDSAPAAADAAKPKIDVRKLFAMNCSWCHDGYGMHAGKGPKLAGTSMTASQVYQRIAKGKSGAMPGYEKTLNPEQIEAFVEYIKGLKDSDG
jgi:mono/diheme cytochrome c family protein